MKYYVLLFLIVVIPLAWASDDYFKVDTVQKQIIETTPRNKITVILSIENTSETQKNIIPSVELPLNFNLLTELNPFTLNGGESQLVFLNFFIPRKTPVGKYNITFFASDLDNPDYVSISVIDINVLPEYDLDVSLLESPKYVFAGEDYTLLYRIENNGNLDTNAFLNIKSSDSLPYEIEEYSEDIPVNIRYNESKIIKITVKTREDINTIINHRFAFTVFAAGDPDVKAERINYVEIVPKVSMEADPYHRFPIEIKLSEASRKYNSWIHEFGGRVYGNGTLDEEGYYNLRFLINKKLNTDDDTMISNPSDQFSISYWTEKTEIWLGDHSFTLSPLIEYNNFARGIRSRIIFPKMSFGAYYHQSLYSNEDNPVAASFADFFVPDENNPLGFKYRAGLNVFSNMDENFIIGVHQQFSPFKDFVFELDSAAGMKFDEKINPAFFLKADGDFSWIHYAFKGIYSAPEYPGFYRDLYHVSSALGFRLFEKRFRIDSSFVISQYNLSLDESSFHAAFSRIIQGGLAYELDSSETDISFVWRNIYSVDKLPDPGFNKLENNFKLSVEQPFKLVKLKVSALFGILDDALNDTRSYLQDYGTSIEINPTQYLSFGIGGKYSNTVESGENTNHTVSWNTDVDFNKEKINVFFNFGNTYYLEEDNLNALRFNYEIGAVFSFNYDQELSVSYNHRILNSDDSWNNSYIVSLEYKKIFNAPMGRKQGISRIDGRIYNEETGKPFSEVIVKIGNLSSVTDKEGYFSFPAVYPGNYYITIDRTTIPSDMISVDEFPIIIEIEEDTDLYRNISLVSASYLKGRIVLYDFDEESMEFRPDDDPESTEPQIKETSGYPNVVVELTDGNDVQRRVTDKDGYFVFDELRPGSWTLKIVSENIPEYHYYEHEAYNIQLEPGESEEMEIKILPQKRTIRFLETEPVLIE